MNFRKSVKLWFDIVSFNILLIAYLASIVVYYQIAEEVNLIADYLFVFLFVVVFILFIGKISFELND